VCVAGDALHAIMEGMWRICILPRRFWLACCRASARAWVTGWRTRFCTRWACLFTVQVAACHAWLDVLHSPPRPSHGLSWQCSWSLCGGPGCPCHAPEMQSHLLILSVTHPAAQSRVHPEQPANTIPAEQVGQMQRATLPMCHVTKAAHCQCCLHWPLPACQITPGVSL